MAHTPPLSWPLGEFAAPLSYLWFGRRRLVVSLPGGAEKPKITPGMNCKQMR